MFFTRIFDFYSAEVEVYCVILAQKDFPFPILIHSEFH